MGCLALYKHLPGMSYGLFCHVHSAKHPCDFADPALVIQGFDA